MLPTGTTRYHHLMASIPVAAKAPGRSTVGPNFPKSQNGTTVQPARDRGERQPLPTKHCASKRAASNVKATY